MQVRAALGAVIKARRIELGWTQEELAERISTDGEYVRQSEISRIENGRIALPRRERLERLAQVLELPLGELLARSGWAGAETHFGSVANEVDERSSNGHLNGSDGLLTTADATARVPAAVQPPFVTRGRSSDSSYDLDAIAAFRRALATMREEFDRLQHNRAVALEMQQHFQKMTNDDRELQAGAGYSSSAGG